MRLTQIFLVNTIFLLTLFLVSDLLADKHESKEVDPASVWDLTELYPNDETWNAARESVLAQLDELKSRKGSLADGATSFYETHQLVSDLYRNALRV